VDKRYGVICFAWPDSRVREIPPSLRLLLRRSEFNTKAKRMGKVIRVADEKINYYTLVDRQIKTIGKS
jgi:hypothetical protein